MGSWNRGWQGRGCAGAPVGSGGWDLGIWKSSWMESRAPAFPDPGRAGSEPSRGLEALVTLVVASGSLHPWIFWECLGFPAVCLEVGPAFLRQAEEGRWQCHQGWDSPRGGAGWIKGAASPSHRTDKIPQDVVTLQPGFLARVAVPALCRVPKLLGWQILVWRAQGRLRGVTALSCPQMSPLGHCWVA